MAARRVSLPRADDLFRPTAVPSPSASSAPAASGPSATEGSVVELAGPAKKTSAEPAQARPVSAVPEPQEQERSRRSSGRVRHDEKMTVYVTADELVDIEHARLTLRRDHGLAVDRGRLVREAIAMVLADFEANGDDSALVRRLTEE